jgi:hypothetical protein
LNRILSAGYNINFIKPYFMNKLILTTALLFLIVCAIAQVPQKQQPYANGTSVSPQPFLFSVNTLTTDAPAWSLNYSGSYGQRTAGPFGYDGVDQQVAVKGYLGNHFTLFANAAVGFARAGGVSSAQQAEVIRDFIGGKKPTGLRFGVGLGLSRDWTSTGAVFSRLTASFDTHQWRMGGNMRFEKAFDRNRDDIDLITSFGFHHRIAGQFFAGLEAVGQDLEGFWDKEEAEGGAKLLIGPSINMVPANSKFAFSLCGGPVFYATRSQVIPSEAIRDITTRNGYTIRAMVSFNLHQ